ncbi:MAG: TadE/TadG family type IV pilus assembly protein [Coprococcus sp.]
MIIKNNGSNSKYTGKKIELYLKGILREDTGSIVIEMCFIAPILIGAVLFSISLFLVVMNKSIAMGELYEALYGKEMYLLDYGTDYKTVIKANIENCAGRQMALADNIDVNISENRNDGTLINNMEGFDKGEFKISMNYENMCKGIIMLPDSSFETGYEARQEIRDTSNNLRRWQIYGNELSD